MVNKVILIGRLTSDPKCGGQAPSNYAFINLAINTRVKDRNSGELKEFVEYLSVSAFNTTADIISRLCHKGDLIYLEGKATSRNINTGGVRVTKMEIHADRIKMLSRAEQDDTPDDLPESE